MNKKKRIIKLLNEDKLSGTEISKVVGCCRSYVSNIKKDQRKVIRDAKKKKTQERLNLVFSIILILVLGFIYIYTNSPCR